MVPNRWAAHAGSQLLNRAGRGPPHLPDPELAALALPLRLVEVGLHPALPILVEVSVGDHVVVANHLQQGTTEVVIGRDSEL